MFYFNDFPRFFQTIAGNANPVYEDSCLRGDASIHSLFIEGNGMFPQFQTDAAFMKYDSNGSAIYDFGACTIQQLLLGKDDLVNNPLIDFPKNQIGNHNRNPCLYDPPYMQYTMDNYKTKTPKHWDFVIINDNTRNPSRGKERAQSLQDLETSYVPLLQKTGAIPIFLWTHAYKVPSTALRNMTGLEDVANFTSLTYAGYKEYVKLLEENLPDAQKPRIAPSGLAWLTVYEENPELWTTLFHNADHIHASPSGTFLQGCVVYYTVFGHMPDKETMVMRTEELPSLWKSARMMQHAWEPPNPFPDEETASYLYEICERVMVNGHIPKSFIDYQNGEVAYGQD